MKGDIGFIITTALKKLLKLKKRIKIVQGGSSAGKTFNIIPILIDKAIKHPNREISIVSESIPHLKRGALKDFIKIMKMLNRWSEVQYNRSSLKYTFRNGSYIEFFGADQADKLRGARRTDLYINEANNVTFEAYTQLSIRTSGDIWVDFNPTNKFWVHKELVDDEDSEFIILTYKDNEALPESIVRELEKNKAKAEAEKANNQEGYWTNWWRVYGEGKVGRLEGVCIKDWKEISMLPTDKEGDVIAELVCYGMDFGYTNDPTTLVALYRFNGAYIYDELIYKTGLMSKPLSDLMDDLDINKNVLIYADRSAPMVIDELEGYGQNITAYLTPPRERNSIQYGISLMNENKIFVTSRSKNLIKELNNYVWAKNSSGETTNNPTGADHQIDASRYALTSYLADPNYGEYDVG